MDQWATPAAGRTTASRSPSADRLAGVHSLTTSSWSGEPNRDRGLWECCSESVCGECPGGCQTSVNSQRGCAPLLSLRFATVAKELLSEGVPVYYLGFPCRVPTPSLS